MKDISTSESTSNNNIIIGNLETNKINDVKGTDTSNPKLSHATNNLIVGNNNELTGNSTVVIGLSNTVTGKDYGSGNGDLQVDDYRYNVVLGFRNKVEGNHNVVLGETNEAKKADNTAVNYTVALGYHAKTLGNNAVAIGVGYTPKANITLKSGIAVNAGKNSKISYQMGAGWVW